MGALFIYLLSNLLSLKPESVAVTLTALLSLLRVRMVEKYSRNASVLRRICWKFSSSDVQTET